MTGPGQAVAAGPCVPTPESVCEAQVGSDVAKELGWLVGQIQHGYLTAATRAVDEVPGGLRGVYVLGAAIRGDAPNQIEVARRFGIDRTVMVHLIDDLEKAGLVERRPDPADRRARMIVGTDRGRDAHDAAQARLRRVEDHVLAPLGPDERAAFTAMAHRVVAHLISLDPTQAESACQAASSQIDTHVPRPGAKG
ncbi:MarR family transcriptional regulator [Frankia sp. CNm7]|uniref:MarR family transcriptional regulator n=1 Tax=Frankia nepalensis TaxID=1836974 RepID=A0A937RJG1_9ACTN|nr:MarR family transcriptional regulator [Frankia nepalensis]MBL7495898.1 MarR family transcriptional regulator [Frankia nepalensis]MBL7510375.1 MarR family transcriptional regulator [Frankia nepalensis]MBL7524171.1 MarR family transcriptional regulator [Frankia nepalensis]MBL7629974.1 MarR family transcriptional regulator [Frankia nepalensis]